ncbi:hypothetical protein ACFYYB_38585 [Streptomyces sp. NPDC002886]|uniref:hypothetical protein n=1 Tax=Streptomyces sp. NPDC002886 TaxID=3364667 RepID=UPI0036C18591
MPDAPDAWKTATITYKVRVNDPLTGDGKLTNHVVARSGRTNCEDGSKDPACAPAPPVITPPDPSPSPSASASAAPSSSPSPTVPSTTQQPRPLPGTAAATLTALGGVVLLSVRRTRGR